MNERLKRLQKANTVLLNQQMSDAGSSQSSTTEVYMGASEDHSTKMASEIQASRRSMDMISDFGQTGQSFRSSSRDFKRQPSLADELRQRREFKETMESERYAHGIMNKSF